MPWIAEDSWNSSYQPLKHWHFFVQHFLEHYICIQTNLPHWMFPDLCWGSFNYNTYKANISLFPKWIHKILSHVSLSFLYTFYPPNTFRIHFVSKITSADANQQKASSPTNKAQEHEFFRNIIMILCHITHMTYVFPHGLGWSMTQTFSSLLKSLQHFAIRCVYQK